MLKYNYKVIIKKAKEYFYNYFKKFPLFFNIIIRVAKKAKIVNCGLA